MGNVVDERLSGHIGLCDLRYKTTEDRYKAIGRRFDRIEKIMYTSTGLVFVQLCAVVIYLLGDK